MFFEEIGWLRWIHCLYYKHVLKLLYACTMRWMISFRYLSTPLSCIFYKYIIMRHNLCIMLQIVVAHLIMMVPSRLSDTTKKRCATHYINQQNALYKIHLSSTNMSQFMLTHLLPAI